MMIQLICLTYFTVPFHPIFFSFLYFSINIKDSRYFVWSFKELKETMVAIFPSTLFVVWSTFFFRGNFQWCLEIYCIKQKSFWRIYWEGNIFSHVAIINLLLVIKKGMISIKVPKTLTFFGGGRWRKERTKKATIKTRFQHFFFLAMSVRCCKSSWNIACAYNLRGNDDSLAFCYFVGI